MALGETGTANQRSGKFEILRAILISGNSLVMFNQSRDIQKERKGANRDIQIKRSGYNVSIIQF